MDTYYNDFTKYLDILTTFAKHIDNRSATAEEFVEYQRLNSEIMESFKENRIDNEEFMALNEVYQTLRDGFESTLGI